MTCLILICVAFHICVKKNNPNSIYKWHSCMWRSYIYIGMRNDHSCIYVWCSLFDPWNMSDILHSSYIWEIPDSRAIKFVGSPSRYLGDMIIWFLFGWRAAFLIYMWFLIIYMWFLIPFLICMSRCSFDICVTFFVLSYMWDTLYSISHICVTFLIHMWRSSFHICVIFFIPSLIPVRNSSFQSSYIRDVPHSIYMTILLHA